MIRLSKMPLRLVALEPLAYVLEDSETTHPFMPHITEEIWHTLTLAGDGQTLLFTILSMI